MNRGEEAKTNNFSDLNESLSKIDKLFEKINEIETKKFFADGVKVDRCFLHWGNVSDSNSNNDGQWAEVQGGGIGGEL